MLFRKVWQKKKCDYDEDGFLKLLFLRVSSRRIYLTFPESFEYQIRITAHID